MSSSRRTFLKTSGLATLAASLHAEPAPPTADTSHSARNQSAPPPASDFVRYVNVLQGTESTFNFSRGNTLPIAALPFGMAHWTLQSFAESPWMFHPSERRVQGFRLTHQLSPWLGDYGHATFLPFSGSTKLDPDHRASSYRPEDARLYPYSMRLHLLRYGIDAELVPTERGALLHISYQESDARGFLFDIPEGNPDKVIHDAGARTIRFTSTANAGGVPPNFATYYVLRFSVPWERVETVALNKSCVSTVHFASGTDPVEVRIATSFISFEQAAANLDRELGTQDLDTIKHKSAAVWNAHLGRIRIEEATPDQQTTFYSCLYRALLFPRVWHEPDASGGLQHRSPYNGKIEPGVMYADQGYWDVYRAWYPLMNLVYPDRLGEILQAWVNAYKEGGWLPQFPCPGYRACMTGSLIDSVFGEAAAKGLQGFDMETAYQALKKHATEEGDPAAGYGRRGLKDYLALHYVAADHVQQSVAETADAAYGDFCIAQVAKALGKEDDYQMFTRRSDNWRNLLDRDTGFLRGKRSTGEWMKPFDPIAWGDPYVEGSAWQHRWDAPHNIPALVEDIGGQEKAVAILDAMLTMPPTFHTGSYDYEIHEMSEMASVRFGQYAHSNQPVHHVLGIYAVAGRPDRTRYWTHRVLEELYSPNAFPGDEDTGSMSAWYILNALGLFVLCPAKPEYVLSLPLFARAQVHYPNGKTLSIERPNLQRKGSITISLNGKPLDTEMIQHSEISAGGRLLFHSSALVTNKS